MLQSLGSQRADITLIDSTGEAPRAGELTHKDCVGVGLGPPQAMVQMGDVEGQLEFVRQGSQDVEQAEGIGATRDPNDNRITGRKQIVFLDGPSDSD